MTPRRLTLTGLRIIGRKSYRSATHNPRACRVYSRHLFRLEFLSVLSMGTDPPGAGARPLHPPTAEHVWLYAIIFLGGVGAFVYILVEVVPDLGLLRQVYDAFGRRKRIKMLEALVLENPASGNYEELGDLYLDEKNFRRAKECYDKAISPRSMHIDPVYRRGIAQINLGDFGAAVADLEVVTSREPKYDSHRAMALLAHAYANIGQNDKAGRCSSRSPSCPRCRKPA